MINPVTPVLALEASASCAPPAVTVHLPVEFPETAVAARVVVVTSQSIWSGPATASAVAAPTVISITSSVGLHPVASEEMVHLSWYFPGSNPDIFVLNSASFEKVGCGLPPVVTTVHLPFSQFAV